MNYHPLTPIDAEEAEQIASIDAFFEAHGENAEKMLTSLSAPYPHNPSTTTLETLKKQYAKPNLVRISINLHPEDIEKAKKVAKDLGVPYQVFIRDFIHESLKSL